MYIFDPTAVEGGRIAVWAPRRDDAHMALRVDHERGSRAGYERVKLEEDETASYRAYRAALSMCTVQAPRVCRMGGCDCVSYLDVKEDLRAA